MVRVFTAPRLAGFLEGNQGNFWARVELDKNEITASSEAGSRAIEINQLANLICEDFKKRVYIFRAERLNIHQGPIGTNPVLASNAQNLPEVLHFLQSSNRYRFQRFVEDV